MTKREFEKIIKLVSLDIIPYKRIQKSSSWCDYSNGVCRILQKRFGVEVRIIFNELMKKRFKTIYCFHWLYNPKLSDEMNQFYRLMVLGEFREQVIERKLYLNF